MAEELNSRLSGSDIRRFEQTLASFDATLARQEEIAQKILKAEQDIANFRIGALEPYFDAYSKGLDEIIARKASKLNDAFLIMEHQAMESYKKAADSAIEESKRIDQAASADSGSNGGSVGGGGNEPPSSNNAEPSKLSDDQRNAMRTAEAEAAAGIADRLAAFNNQYKTLEEQRNAITKREANAITSIDDLRAARQEARKKQQEEYSEKEIKLQNTLTALTAARMQESKDKAAQLQEVRIANIQEAANAELELQNYLNKANAERSNQEKYSDEAAAAEARKAKAIADKKSSEQIESARILFIQREELKAKRKNNGVLEVEEAARIRRQANDKFKLEQENIEKLSKQREEREAKAAHKAGIRATDQAIASATSFSGYDKYNSVLDRFETLKNIRDDAVDSGMSAGIADLTVAVKALSSLAQQLDTKVDEIAAFKGNIDTRLQGSSNETRSGSYWDQIVKDITKVGAINPFFKQETFANKIKELVNAGIAFDLEQRAFLATISDKIATTFNVADSTLLRLIRLQQEDSTAGRLGMESALNAFLNSMYENTEYLQQVASSVRSSLAEMESLMAGAEATEVEYQVQKWLGSLYSVGMSDAAVTSISNTLGQIAAGQIEGLINGGTGNLLVMAADNAGLSIADILTSGIDAKETNKLMQAVVNYLAEIAESTKDNNVVQQQLANVFGVKASDLRAATNLATQNSIGTIYNSSMTYNNMLGQLYNMAGTLQNRTSLGEMMTNVWNNVQYSLAGGMASNPAAYLLYKVATVLDDTTGGIAIPAISVMGNMVDLHTTVADLMRVGALSGGVLGSLGDLMSGLGNSFSGQSMLTQLGIKKGSGLAVTPRGEGGYAGSVGGGAKTTSGSGYVGNASSSDIKSSTMQEAEDSKKQLMVEAQEEADTNQVSSINTTVLKIYELLDSVTNGSNYLRVKVENYGLTRGTSSSTLGGVNALDNSYSDGSINSGSTASSSLSAGGVNAGGAGGSVTFGGWTTVI